MQRRRESPAAAETPPAPVSQVARVELFRRVVDAPRGPRGAAVFRPAGLREQPSPFVEAVPMATERRLAVGEGIRLAGEITACDRLVVHGEASVVLDQVEMLEVGRSGRFDGRAQVAEAEIAGRFEGELTVSGRLLIRSTGTVEGTVRFGELEIERGGRLIGSVAELVEAPVALAAKATVVGNGD